MLFELRPKVTQVLDEAMNPRNLDIIFLILNYLYIPIVFTHCLPILDCRGRPRRPPQLEAVVAAGGGRVPALRLRRNPLLGYNADPVGALRRAAHGGRGRGGDGDGLAQPQGGQRVQGLLGQRAAGMSAFNSITILC